MSVMNSTGDISFWQCCFFSLSSLQIWPLMTRWNTFCSWTRHLWTIVWLTVLPGAVFCNYPFSAAEHFQHHCLDLPLCASRSPYSLVMILLIKCTFITTFFFLPERTSLYKRHKTKDATIATKLPALEVPCDAFKHLTHLWEHRNFWFSRIGTILSNLVLILANRKNEQYKLCRTTSITASNYDEICFM